MSLAEFVAFSGTVAKLPDGLVDGVLGSGASASNFSGEVRSSFCGDGGKSWLET